MDDPSEDIFAVIGHLFTVRRDLELLVKLSEKGQISAPEKLTATLATTNEILETLSEHVRPQN